VQTADCQEENQFTSQPFNSPYPTSRGSNVHLIYRQAPPSFRSNPPDKTRSPKPNKTLETALKRAPFLRGLEEENCTSTLFGISTLKRLSRVRQKACPLSREIFKAHKGSIVKIDLFDF
jgi:hypothetical protein